MERQKIKEKDPNNLCTGMDLGMVSNTPSSWGWTRSKPWASSSLQVSLGWPGWLDCHLLPPRVCAVGRKLERRAEAGLRLCNMGCGSVSSILTTIPSAWLHLEGFKFRMCMAVMVWSSGVRLAGSASCLPASDRCSAQPHAHVTTPCHTHGTEAVMGSSSEVCSEWKISN